MIHAFPGTQGFFLRTFFSVGSLAAAVCLGSTSLAQSSEPPSIDPGPPPPYIPPPVGERTVPPFNAAEPGSDELTYGQTLDLRVISTYPAGATIQWYKDGHCPER